MSLTETVILKLGSAVAKSIFLFWVKDIPVISGVSSSIVDIIESQISDKIAQQKARRQFEAIGEKIGESLLSVFELEGAHIDEGSRTAVALAVAETFQKSQFKRAYYRAQS